MKKILSLLLAVVMLTASVAAMAAPTAQYVFYDEDDGKYYVFGSYQNSVIKGANVLASDVGIYVNGTKYSYVKDGEVDEEGKTNLDKSNAMANPKFGIAFQTRANYFNDFVVVPYAVDTIGEKIGATHIYDYSSNTKIESDNANLKYVGFSRPGGANTHFMIKPDFSPEVTEYEVYGSFRDSGSGDRGIDKVTIKCITEDPGATANVVVASSKAGTSTVTVTAANGNTKTYSFVHKVNDQLGYSAGRYTAPSGIGNLWYQGETTVDTTVISTNYYDLLSYPAGLNKKSILFTFPLTADMADLDQIGFSFNGSSYTSVGEYNDVELSLKKITLAENYTIHENTLCYRDVKEGRIVIGDEIARLGIESFDEKGKNRRFTMDVTDAVKDAIANNETSISFELSVDNYSLPATADNNNFMLRVYAKHATSAQWAPQLIY